MIMNRRDDLEPPLRKLGRDLVGIGQPVQKYSRVFAVWISLRMVHLPRLHIEVAHRQNPCQVIRCEFENLILVANGPFVGTLLMEEVEQSSEIAVRVFVYLVTKR